MTHDVKLVERDSAISPGRQSPRKPMLLLPDLVLSIEGSKFVLRSKFVFRASNDFSTR